MSAETCKYVASQTDPDTWNGDAKHPWLLNEPYEDGGLEITEWQCPHPSLKERERCVFHTDPNEIPEEIDESEELLAALDQVGQSPLDDRPEHRGQFVGATFGGLDLGNNTIEATDEYGVRFDHAVFRGDNEDLNFNNTDFIASDERLLSFYGARFEPSGDGKVNFADAVFRTSEYSVVVFSETTFKPRGGGDVDFTGVTINGNVMFSNVTFETVAEGDVNFVDSTFEPSGDGYVNFERATFKPTEGDINFEGATFNPTDEEMNFESASFKPNEGGIYFKNSTLKTDGDGDLNFNRATFEATKGEVSFCHTAFKSEGYGNVNFGDATFKSSDSYVRFNDTTFTTDGKGNVIFEDSVFKSTKYGVNFSKGAFETDGGGYVSFSHAIFEAGDSGNVNFESATFASDDGNMIFSNTTFEAGNNYGFVIFLGASFKTRGKSDILFKKAIFEAGGYAEVEFSSTTFHTGDIGDVSFKQAIFKTGGGNIKFSAAEFETGDGDVSFWGATFGPSGNVIFSDATYETRNGKVDFHDTIFNPSGDSNVIFSDGIFNIGNGDITFWKTTFQLESDGNVDFNCITITIDGDGDMDFREARFEAGTDGEVDFTQLTLNSDNGSLVFDEAEFSNRTLFTNIYSTEGTSLSFVGATFSDQLVFGEIEAIPVIRGRLNFSNASFFKSPKFQGDSNSFNHIFDATTEQPLFDAVFVNPVDFSGAKFPDRVDFSNIRFPPKSNFNETIISGGNLIGSDLSGCSFERSQLNRVEMMNTNLQGARLYGALLGDARINRNTQFWPTVDMSLHEVSNPDGSRVGGGYWRQMKTLLRGGRVPYCAEDSRFGDLEIQNLPPQQEVNLEKAAEVYSTIEQVARDNSLPRLASEAFLGRKDVQYREYIKQDRLTMRIRAFVPNLVARYGESPWRVLLAGVVIVAAWGVIYRALGLIEPVSDASDPTLLDSIYFSALTFTTLGYGDFRPSNGLGQFLAVSETALGVVLLAILVFVFGRRATR